MLSAQRICFLIGLLWHIACGGRITPSFTADSDIETSAYVQVRESEMDIEEHNMAPTAMVETDGARRRRGSGSKGGSKSSGDADGDASISGEDDAGADSLDWDKINAMKVSELYELQETLEEKVAPAEEAVKKAHKAYSDKKRAIQKKFDLAKAKHDARVAAHKAEKFMIERWEREEALRSGKSSKKSRKGKKGDTGLDAIDFDAVDKMDESEAKALLKEREKMMEETKKELRAAKDKYAKSKRIYKTGFELAEARSQAREAKRTADKFEIERLELQLKRKKALGEVKKLNAIAADLTSSRWDVEHEA